MIFPRKMRAEFFKILPKKSLKLFWEIFSFFLTSVELVDRWSFQKNFLSCVEWMRSWRSFHKHYRIFFPFVFVSIFWLKSWASFQNKIRTSIHEKNFARFRMNSFFHTIMDKRVKCNRSIFKGTKASSYFLFGEIGNQNFDSTWCSRGDLNPHTVRHTHLKRTCLPFHHPSKYLWCTQ